MKVLLMVLVLASAFGIMGCAHNEKSGCQIIDVGDRNPDITVNPTRAGERTRYSDEPR